MIRLIILCAFCVAPFYVAFAAPTNPNVVLIIADDLGYGELGCYGGTEIPTPHIDALAKSGQVYTNGYVTASYCAASRAGLMTGRYQTRFGFEANPIGASNMNPKIGLPTSERTIAANLKDAGYATALIGKWHLGGTADYHPQRRGFDEFFGFLHEGHFFLPPPWENTTTWLRRKSLPHGGKGRWTSADQSVVWSTHMGHNEPPYDADNPILRSSQPVDEPQNLTTAFTREACDFIARHRDQPFFLTVAYNAVHSPLQGDHRYMEKFSHIEDIQRRIFAAMLSHLDDGVGKLLATIDENSLNEETLVIFLSDNGGPTKELTSSNSPLRGGKGSLYEGGIRVPFIARWKDHIKPGVVRTPVISTDIAATLKDLVDGLNIDQEKVHDGASLLPVFDEPDYQLPPRVLYWRMGNKSAIRAGDLKATKHGTAAWELFDLSADVRESKNLASERVNELEELTKKWKVWDSQQSQPLW